MMFIFSELSKPMFCVSPQRLHSNSGNLVHFKTQGSLGFAGPTDFYIQVSLSFDESQAILKKPSYLFNGLLVLGPHIAYINLSEPRNLLYYMDCRAARV